MGGNLNMVMTETGAVVLGIIAPIFFARIARGITGSTVGELIITGAIIAGFEAYHFMLQPNITFIHLPELPAMTQIFIATFGIVRALLLSLEVIPPTRQFARILTG